jgi:hypothetical protein
MLQTGFDRTEEELLQERAEALYRAGSELEDSLQALKDIERDIEGKILTLKEGGILHECKPLRNELENDIRQFNEKREYAKLRYYYLVVIREAIGFRNHKWIEETYKIPEKKLHEQI